MAIVIEELHFKFYFILITLNLNSCCLDSTGLDPISMDTMEYINSSYW